MNLPFAQPLAALRSSVLYLEAAPPTPAMVNATARADMGLNEIRATLARFEADCAAAMTAELPALPPCDEQSAPNYGIQDDCYSEDALLAYARAAILHDRARRSAQPEAPPREPTPEMLAAGADAACREYGFHGKPSDPVGDAEAALATWRTMYAVHAADPAAAATRADVCVAACRDIPTDRLEGMRLVPNNPESIVFTLRRSDG